MAPRGELEAPGQCWGGRKGGPRLPPEGHYLTYNVFSNIALHPLVSQDPAELGTHPGLAFLTQSWAPALLDVSHPYSQLSPAQGPLQAGTQTRPLSTEVASPWVWLGCFDPAQSSWSPLICFCEIVRFWAGQREVTPPEFGCACPRASRDSSRILPGPSTQFRGN